MFLMPSQKQVFLHAVFLRYERAFTNTKDYAVNSLHPFFIYVKFKLLFKILSYNAERLWRRQINKASIYIVYLPFYSVYYIAILIPF